MKILKVKFTGECNSCEKERDIKVRIVCDEKCYEKTIVDLCNKCAHELIDGVKNQIKG